MTATAAAAAAAAAQLLGDGAKIADGSSEEGGRVRTHAATTSGSRHLTLALPTGRQAPTVVAVVTGPPAPALLALATFPAPLGAAGSCGRGPAHPRAALRGAAPHPQHLPARSSTARKAQQPSSARAPRAGAHVAR